MPKALIAAAALTFVLLGWGIESAGLAARWTDPVSHVRSQDESVYANAATRMAQDGQVLTPRFLGRFLLYKPPLLIWLAALSVKLFGNGAWALRLPVLLIASFGALLVFRWDAQRGWIALLLFLGDPLWHTFARLCYTDMLNAVFTLAALTVLARDPDLARRMSLWGFAGACAGCAMSKSAAAAVPLAAYLLCSGWRNPKRAGLALLAFGAIAAPWHLYQLAVHRQWFWTEYVGIQLLGFGLRPPAQYSGEPAALFYARRLLAMDPVLLAAAAAALPFWLAALRRDRRAQLLAAWTAVAGAALLAFQYRNLPYLLQIIAPLSLAAALFLPRSRWVMALAAAAVVVRVSVPAMTWSLPLRAPEPIPSAGALAAYAAEHREAPLFVVEPDDEYVSANLGVRAPHYLFVDPAGTLARYGPHYRWLGITMPGAEYDRLGDVLPRYRGRLASWGLDSTEPVATAITFDSREELTEFLSRHPEADVFESGELRQKAFVDPGHARNAGLNR